MRNLIIAVLCLGMLAIVNDVNAGWIDKAKKKYESIQRDRQLKKDQNTVGGFGRKETQAERESRNHKTPDRDNTQVGGESTRRTVAVLLWSTYPGPGSGKTHHGEKVTDFHFDDEWKYYSKAWDHFEFYKNGNKWVVPVSEIKYLLFVKDFTWKGNNRVKIVNVVLKDGSQNRASIYLTADYRAHGGVNGKSWSTHLNDIKMINFDFNQ